MPLGSTHEAPKQAESLVDEPKGKPGGDAWLAVLMNRDNKGAQAPYESTSKGNVDRDSQSCDAETLKLLMEVTGTSMDKGFLGHVLCEHGHNPEVCFRDMNSLLVFFSFNMRQ